MQPGPKIGEAHVPKLAASLVAVLAAVMFCGAGVALARVVLHGAPFAEWHSAALLASVIVLIPAHEGLHALGLRWFARVPWTEVRFGVMWRILSPYCRCMAPIPIQAFRRMVLLPLYVTGGTTVALLLLFPADWTALVAGTAIAICTGDVWVAAKLSRFAGNLLALDSPSEIGCDVFAPAAGT
jgi:hypothetical protein